ncbi:hypothetical protein DSL64_07685 [Dyadobacter luteus]|uniref:Uncharacterized protein n=1 Tax=Dyadobacter luteus TaxID=2259619 RepID=A0A3D8YE41_9BACT|nr:hypothetical protein [Dyadobacter luteus]REA62794.1 hypothetical protein DSL64_07685 [Dyadobacter luteus]
MKLNKSLFQVFFLTSSTVCSFFSPSELLAQVKIGSNTTTIATNTNLEVESNNGSVFRINKTTGQVRIQDGSEGAGKVFTSNAKGVGTWMDTKTRIASGNTGTPPNITGRTTNTIASYKYSNIKSPFPRVNG